MNPIIALAIALIAGGLFTLGYFVGLADGKINTPLPAPPKTQPKEQP